MGFTLDFSGTLPEATELVLRDSVMGWLALADRSGTGTFTGTNETVTYPVQGGAQNGTVAPNGPLATALAQVATLTTQVTQLQSQLTALQNQEAAP